MSVDLARHVSSASFPSFFATAHRPAHEEPAEPDPAALPVEPDLGPIQPLTPVEDPQGEPVPDPKP